MRLRFSTVLALAVAAMAPPARAELNARYRGVDRMSGMEVPATAQLSVGPDRAALSIKGSATVRILFWEDTGTLRIVDDTKKTYVDLEQCAGPAAGGAAMMSEIEGLTSEQRQMADDMIKQSAESDRGTSQPEYVWTKRAQKVLGYDCTVVEVNEGGEKRAEYCGCKSKDFEITEAERAIVRAMQTCLGSFLMTVKPFEGATAGAFRWDSSTDGFPLVSRCLEDQKIVFDVTMESFDRKKLSDDLFSLPADYTSVDFSTPPTGE